MKANNIPIQLRKGKPLLKSVAKVDVTKLPFKGIKSDVLDIPDGRRAVLVHFRTGVATRRVLIGFFQVLNLAPPLGQVKISI